MNKIRRHTKRTAIAIAGGIVLLVGLVMIPYPGPGWLVVFAGLAILATEFAIAGKLLEHARARYDAWVTWLQRQHRGVQVAVLIATGLVVVVTLWLLNTFGFMNQLLNLGQDWLHSPFVRSN